LLFGVIYFSPFRLLFDVLLLNFENPLFFVLFIDDYKLLFFKELGVGDMKLEFILFLEFELVRPSFFVRYKSWELVGCLFWLFAWKDLII
jgi:hypothetical protein